MEIPSEKILFDFFSGKATPLQRRMIEEWLKQPGNEHLYYDYLHKWESENLQYLMATPLQPDWSQSIFDSDTRPQVQPPQSIGSSDWKRRFSLWGLAASVLLVCLSSLYFFRTTFLYKTYRTSFAQTRTILLNDGTNVTLNANSILTVPRYFSFTTDREVWLTGEAFFKVTKKPNKQRFVVHTPAVAVEVLGTRFNVSNRHGKSEVVLEEGKVQLHPVSPSRQVPIVLQPGESMSLSPSDTIFTKKKVQSLHYTSWRSKRLIFEDKPLSEVAQTLQDYYGISVKIKNRSLAQRKFTGTLPTNNLAIVLESLSTMYKLEIEQDKKQIILR